MLNLYETEKCVYPHHGCRIKQGSSMKSNFFSIKITKIDYLYLIYILFYISNTMNSSEQTDPSIDERMARTAALMALIQDMSVQHEEMKKSGGAQPDKNICSQPCGRILYGCCLCCLPEIFGKVCCYICCNSYVCGQCGIETRKEIIAQWCSNCHLLRGHSILPKKDIVVIISQPQATYP